MLTCPKCRYDNPAGAASCARCGRGFVESDEMPSAAITLVDRARTGAVMTVGPSQMITVTPLPDLPVENPLARGLPSVEDLSPPPAAANTPPERAAPPKPKLVVVRGERLGVEYKV